MAIIRKFNNEDKVIANKSVIDHNELTNRDQYGAHSISAIRKLPEKLTALKEKDAELSQAIIDEETRAKNRENAIEENAQRISLVDNNDSTLTFTNYDGETNNVKSGHLVDGTTIQEINDRSTLQVIGVKGTFEKDNQSITKVYDAEDIYDDIKSSEQISLTAQLDNGNNPTGKLLFKDYSGVVSEVQGGFLPDDDTIQLSNNKLAIKKVYVDSDTIVGDGASIDSKLNAKAIKDANGTITVSQINTMSSEIQSIQGRGGYLRPYDFQTASPNLPKDNLTAQPPVHSLLTQYALQEIDNITNPIDIFNGTRVTNLFNNHTWILNNTQDTNPIVFEWVDLGQSLVSVATNDTLGVVKGSDQDLEGSIDVNGVITINSLSQELSDLHTNKQDVMQVSTMPNAGVDYLNKIYQFIGTSAGGYTNGYFYKCTLNNQSSLYEWTRIDVQPATPLVWGNITGTLSNQTDLQNALDLKENLSNKSTNLSDSSTDTQYPSAKAVYDAIPKVIDISGGI